MKFSIAIHGGAGTITRALMTPEKELAYTAGLDAALACGEAILKAGGTALDAVQAAVVDLENNHLFNAGRGSVFTNKGTHEMDAALMCGATLNAGAVAGIHSVKNPIAFCRTVMDKSGHVFLAGQQAVDFAKLQGIELKDEAYFKDDFRYNQWLEVKDQEVYQLDHSGDKKFGTVGAVALDSHGNLAAATSTGGMTNKRWGRIGDSPVIGAGTYANNNSVAISCTGHGEYFIRAVVAYDIACLMEYAGMTLEQACEKVVMDKLVKMGGEGGLIAIDNRGNICLPFNSEGMYRGLATESGREVRIYRE